VDTVRQRFLDRSGAAGSGARCRPPPSRFRKTTSQKWVWRNAMTLTSLGKKAERKLTPAVTGFFRTSFSSDTASYFPSAPLPGMIGNSRVMQPVYRPDRLLASRNTAVLITGPTGCGKEVVARAIHHLSPRAVGRLQSVNCAAIPETMLEADS